MKIHTRWVLAIALATAQLLCLLAASAWYAQWLHNGLTQLMCGQVAAINAQIIAELTEVIDEWQVRDLQPGGPGWTRLQRLVERIQVPNQGYISIIDSKTGQVLCHPSWSDWSRRKNLEPSLTLIQQRLGLPAPNGGISGWVETQDGTHYITARDVPHLGVMLVADQREDGILAAVDYMSTPVWSMGLLVAGILVLLSAVSSVYIVRRYDSKLEQVNAGLEQMVERRSRELLNVREAVIFGLAKLADSRSSETGQHLERIREYVIILARQLAKSRDEIDEEFIDQLQLASSLHDIGKVGIPDDILLKPGKLTSAERRVMQTHAMLGAQCLTAIQQRLGGDDFLDMACDIAAAHHERWDGSGYPYGIKGNEIPLSARIVAVADVYDALTTHRVYKPALSHEIAASMILEGAGTQFDPDVVDAFRCCQRAIKKVSVKLSSGAFHAILPPDLGHALPLNDEAVTGA